MASARADLGGADLARADLGGADLARTDLGRAADTSALQHRCQPINEATTP